MCVNFLLCFCRCCTTQLSDFVTQYIWTMISENMLKTEDQTDGGPPSDDAVDDLLRNEGKYVDSSQQDQMLHDGPLQAFQNLNWVLKRTNVSGFEKYIVKWMKLKRTVREVQMSSQEKLTKSCSKQSGPNTSENVILFFVFSIKKFSEQR